jgi:hypothetical protein
MDAYVFSCRCNDKPFEVEAAEPSRTLHLTLGVCTLGVWLVLNSVYRMIHLYWISRCPKCRKRSRSVFWAVLILLLFTAELGRVLHYFLISAPHQIVADASFAEMPQDMQLDAPLETKDLKKALGFVWLFAGLPTAGFAIASYWPYIVLGWLSILTIAGYMLPSFYLKRGEH